MGIETVLLVCPMCAFWCFCVVSNDHSFILPNSIINYLISILRQASPLHSTELSQDLKRVVVTTQTPSPSPDPPAPLSRFPSFATCKPYLGIACAQTLLSVACLPLVSHQAPPFRQPYILIGSLARRGGNHEMTEDEESRCAGTVGVPYKNQADSKSGRTNLNEASRSTPVLLL